MLARNFMTPVELNLTEQQHGGKWKLAPWIISRRRCPDLCRPHVSASSKTEGRG